MEMSTGVSLLRTAQSLLTGRTISAELIDRQVNALQRSSMRYRKRGLIGHIFFLFLVLPGLNRYQAEDKVSCSKTHHSDSAAVGLELATLRS